MSSTRTLLQNQTIAFDVSYNESSAWQEVDSDLPHAEEKNHHLWHRHIGKAIGSLLFNAGYSPEAQRQSLDFFKQHVAPFLGVFQAAGENYKNPWQSFMTDDGTPMELSWDWGTNDSRPTIRYSVEPIGLQAGTPADPKNMMAGSLMQESLNRALPDMNLEWYRYFKDFFDGSGEETSDLSSSIILRWFRFVKDLLIGPAGNPKLQDHNTSIFYAFDITEKDTTAKVYYFPKYRAMSTGKSNLEVLLEGMRCAPHITGDNIPALSVFSAFANDTANKELEYEMLAIDLIDPRKSRFKIYFRSRETSFDSLRNILSMGGRIKGPNIQKGLDDLHQLWNAIFGVDAPSSDHLKDVKHRTAGMLYNVEFRIGDQFPVAKLYLPVRHYAASDQKVISGLDTYFKTHKRGSYMSAYSRTMNSLFGSGALASKADIHTYIGCTIRPDGSLRVVSYFKAPFPEAADLVERSS
ncbi:tryptophan dimethylallyltransferase-domain-containing protein [Xylaria palmicola]|nr:tryptophan dimethylallyltransferase-domain-containing protein [Xylaria palmicola]